VPAPPPDVAVLGGGLAGVLLALELATRGAVVRLVESCAGATSLSYGGVPWWSGPSGPLDALMATAPACWERLEQRHGPLGLESCALRLHWSEQEEAGGAAAAAIAAVEALAGRHLPAIAIERQGRELRLPYVRVDARRLSAALPQALERAGVRRETKAAMALRWEAAHWRVLLADGSALASEQVVLAAGATCRALWPELPQRLRVSWAGVLALEALPASASLPPDLRDIHMPLLGGRHGLEARADVLRTEEWIVDPGLAPWGEGLLLGQTSLVRPGLAKGAPPEPAELELALRHALNALSVLLPDGGAPLWRAARFHQVPVSFSTTGIPLAGPVQGAHGLWAFVGFGGPFALVPPLAPRLAAALDGDGQALARWRGEESDS
jgi:glycine/D-amino acid oxidase-like deaminating enzyme